ncbi:MAG: sulfotransferase [Planctomycetes bacterium]|nr:sulfotransferase [Planctomycetota bacterium]
MVSSLIATPNAYLACLNGGYASAVATPFPLAVARRLFAGHQALAARLIVSHLARETRRYLRSRDQILDKDCFDVKYESLCDQPRETLEGVLSWLDVDQSFPLANDEVARPLRIQGDVFPLVRELMAARLSPYARRIGYDLSARGDPRKG